VQILEATRVFGAGCLVLASLVVSGCSAQAAQPVASVQVVGYAEAGSTPVSRLDASRKALTTVGVDGINVGPDGASLSPVSSEARSLLQAAHARGEKAELLLGNFDAGLGDFSPRIGDALLGSPAHIDAVVSQLGDVVEKGGWDGVTIDLESLSPKYPSGLTSLVTKLHSALGPGKSVSVCVMASTGGYRELGYDLRGLGRAADHVVLMAYDQHGPTWSSAGPIGGMPWVTKTLAPLLATIARSKLQLGIAGYGYTWPGEGSGVQVSGVQVSDADARARVTRDGATPVWSAKQQEWHTTLRNGTVMWWSDAKSYRARLAYAERLHLGGVAVWSLGLADPLPDRP
jgi:spore germination protein YaaH